MFLSADVLRGRCGRAQLPRATIQDGETVESKLSAGHSTSVVEGRVY